MRTTTLCATVLSDKKYNLAVKTGEDFVVEVESTRKPNFLRGAVECDNISADINYRCCLNLSK